MHEIEWLRSLSNKIVCLGDHGGKVEARVVHGLEVALMYVYVYGGFLISLEQGRLCLIRVEKERK